MVQCSVDLVFVVVVVIMLMVLLMVVNSSWRFGGVRIRMCHPLLLLLLLLWCGGFGIGSGGDDR